MTKEVAPSAEPRTPTCEDCGETLYKEDGVWLYQCDCDAIYRELLRPDYL